MEEKKNNYSPIVITVLLVLCVGLLCYIFYNRKTSNLSNEAAINTNTNANNSQLSNNNNEPIQCNSIINFDKTKCINCDKTNFNITSENNNISRDGVSSQGVSVSIDENNENVVNFQLQYDAILGIVKKNNTDNYYDTVSLTFPKKVEHIFMGRLGMTPDDIIILFILEDGSLEYVRYYDIAYNQTFTNIAINNVSDIVRFDIVSLSAKIGSGSKTTTIAYKIDGTYYDLSEYITIP